MPHRLSSPVTVPTRIARRIRDAWRVLLHGLPAEPPPESAPALTEATVAQLRYTIECVLAGAGLPYDWTWRATSSELDTVRIAVSLAAALRADDWRIIEAARGMWPAAPPVHRS